MINLLIGRGKYLSAYLYINIQKLSIFINLRIFTIQSNGVLYGDNLLPEGAPPTDQEAQIESLERRLRQQQFESERDGKWLAEEETNLVHVKYSLTRCFHSYSVIWFYILFSRFQFAEKTTLRRSQLIRQRLSRRPKFVHATVETFRLIGSFSYSKLRRTCHRRQGTST